MRKSKAYSILFAVLGLILALAAVCICLFMRDASAKLLVPSRGAAECTENLFSRISAGDYAGASAYLYGSPKLDSGEEPESITGRVIWDAFTSSLTYELTGDSWATPSGISQKVRVQGLDITSVTGQLKSRAQELLEQRVDSAENMDEVYDENFDYREEFVAQVLRDAAAEAIAKDSEVSDQEITVNLVYDKDQWWVVPDQALLNAISGGILGES